MKAPEQIVIKVGTSTLTQGTTNLSHPQMLEIARQISQLHAEGKKIVLVSSGSIAAGREVMRNPKTDRSVPAKQMLSAVGQVRLMQIWTELFSNFNITVGQVLLSRADFSNRDHYLNIRNTLASLLDHHVLPIINENDTVATQEIKIGDNDNLSALCANLIAADLLILLTDTEGLFTADPTTNPSATLIPVVTKIDQSVFDLAGKTKKGMGMGTGGMYTKVEAAKLATHSGTATVIATTKTPNVILDLASGKKHGTLFLAETTTLESRKRWLLSEKPQGKIVIDDGAVKKLTQEGASLLPIGITETQNSFTRGAIIQAVSKSGIPVAVGISNYSENDIKRLIGKHSKEIPEILGYSYGPEVIHRDNMTLLPRKRDPHE